MYSLLTQSTKPANWRVRSGTRHQSCSHVSLACGLSCKWNVEFAWVSWLAACVAAWLPCFAWAQPSQPVTLHYVQRPPYMVATHGGLEGLTGGPSYQAFLKAQVPVVLAETPFARQLRYLETNAGLDCMIGMFKKPERERFAKYTKPVYQDKPQLILTAASNAARFSNHNSVVDVFGDKSKTLLVKLGYSYGVTLDALIEKYQPTIRKTTDENLAMLRQIKLGLADYMFVAPEEAVAAIESAGFHASDFSQIAFANMPAGEYRHLLCSRNVPDEVIQKLNAAISFRK